MNQSNELFAISSETPNHIVESNHIVETDHIVSPVSSTINEPVVDSNHIVESDHNVEVEISLQVGEATTRQPTCSRRLGEHVVNEFNSAIAVATEESDNSYLIKIPYPDQSIYAGCSKPTEFIPKACMANPKIITIVHAQLVKANPDLASTHTFKIAANVDSVEILVRPRPVANTASASAASAPVNRYQSTIDTAAERGKPFPTQEEVQATLDAVVPHKEGLSRSAVYTVGSDENGVALFCRRLGLKYCITKDQPKQSNLVRFRIFAENKEGFVAKPSKSGRGDSAASGGGGGSKKNGNRSV